MPSASQNTVAMTLPLKHFCLDWLISTPGKLLLWFSFVLKITLVEPCVIPCNSTLQKSFRIFISLVQNFPSKHLPWLLLKLRLSFWETNVGLILYSLGKEHVKETKKMMVYFYTSITESIFLQPLAKAKVDCSISEKVIAATNLASWPIHLKVFETSWKDHGGSLPPWTKSLQGSPLWQEVAVYQYQAHIPQEQFLPHCSWAEWPSRQPGSFPVGVLSEPAC